jgi:hypothetical protein
MTSQKKRKQGDEFVNQMEDNNLGDTLYGNLERKVKKMVKNITNSQTSKDQKISEESNYNNRIPGRRV